MPDEIPGPQPEDIYSEHKLKARKVDVAQDAERDLAAQESELQITNQTLISLHEWADVDEETRSAISKVISFVTAELAKIPEDKHNQHTYTQQLSSELQTHNETASAHYEANQDAYQRQAVQDIEATHGPGATSFVPPPSETTLD